MPTKRKCVTRDARQIPAGILNFLLGEPRVPTDVPDGTLETFRRSPAELLEAYLPAMTLQERRKALRFARDVAAGRASYWSR